VISIVDPEELRHVLRPTVYAAAVGLRAGTSLKGVSNESAGSPARADALRRDEPVSPSQHD